LPFFAASSKAASPVKKRNISKEFKINKMEITEK